MTITDFLILFSILFLCNFVLFFLFFNMNPIGQTVNTILGRIGVVIGVSDTHYRVFFRDGTISWYRISFLKDGDRA